MKESLTTNDDPHVSRVLEAAEIIAGDHGRAVEWLQSPLATFDGKTPLALIAEGHVDDVLRHLASIESGYVG